MKHMTPRQQQFFESLPSSWKKPLEHVCETPAIDKLIQFLQEREDAGAKIYPAKKIYLPRYVQHLSMTSAW